MKVSKPYVVPRESWSNRTGEINYNTMNQLISVDALVIHHTEGNSGVTGSDAIDALRNIEYDHLYLKDGTGWSDLGYHYLISHDGTIYEGRSDEYGGAHVDHDYWNSHSLAISCIGNFMSDKISSDQKRSLVRLLAWLKQEHGVKFSEICGHRDKNSSSCPGDALYAQIPNIRDQVAYELGYLPE